MKSINDFDTKRMNFYVPMNAVIKYLQIQRKCWVKNKRKITMYRYDEQLENSTNPYDNWHSRSVPLQLLPTKLYTGKKIKTTNPQDYTCRMCGNSQESVALVLVVGSSATTQTKYLERHNSILRILFF